MFWQRENNNGRKTNKPAPNGRFGAMAAVTPQKMQYEFGSYYPAGSSVEAATAPSRLDVAGNAGKTSG